MPYKNIPESASTAEARTLPRKRRIAHAGRVVLASVGVARPRNADGSLGDRHGKRLAGLTGALIVGFLLSTMIHIVPAGSIGVPVTLGRAG
ncbi:MAG TPA: hypothetical protein VGB41_00315, partial [Acidimicrobiia bacterium]